MRKILKQRDEGTFFYMNEENIKTGRRGNSLCAICEPKMKM